MYQLKQNSDSLLKQQILTAGGDAELIRQRVQQFLELERQQKLNQQVQSVVPMFGSVADNGHHLRLV